MGCIRDEHETTTEMPETAPAKRRNKPGAGRPKTGQPRRLIVKLTILPSVAADAKAIAFGDGKSLSSYVETLLVTGQHIMEFKIGDEVRVKITEAYGSYQCGILLGPAQPYAEYEKRRNERLAQRRAGVKCQDCNGSGVEMFSDQSESCDRCKGTGLAQDHEPQAPVYDLAPGVTTKSAPGSHRWIYEDYIVTMMMRCEEETKIGYDRMAQLAEQLMVEKMSRDDNENRRVRPSPGARRSTP